MKLKIVVEIEFVFIKKANEKDDNNILIHKYGPHLFHTNNKEVFEYLAKFTNWEIYNHKVLAYIDGKEVSIPFNFDTISDLFPKQLANKLEKKLLETFQYNAKIPILELKNSKDKELSQDNVFSTLLGLFDIKTKVYEKNMDITK